MSEKEETCGALNAALTGWVAVLAVFVTWAIICPNAISVLLAALQAAGIIAAFIVTSLFFDSPTPDLQGASVVGMLAFLGYAIMMILVIVAFLFALIGYLIDKAEGG